MARCGTACNTNAHTNKLTFPLHNFVKPPSHERSHPDFLTPASRTPAMFALRHRPALPLHIKSLRSLRHQSPRRRVLGYSRGRRCKAALFLYGFFVAPKTGVALFFGSSTFPLLQIQKQRRVPKHAFSKQVGFKQLLQRQLELQQLWRQLPQIQEQKLFFIPHVSVSHSPYLATDKPFTPHVSTDLPRIRSAVRITPTGQLHRAMVTSSSRAGALGFLISAVLFVALLSPHIPVVKARVLTQFQSLGRTTDTFAKGEEPSSVVSAAAARTLLQFGDEGDAASDESGDSGSGDYGGAADDSSDGDEYDGGADDGAADDSSDGDE
jgi:hypothetical protein